jgi:hypothetical protein
MARRRLTWAALTDNLVFDSIPTCCECSSALNMAQCLLTTLGHTRMTDRYRMGRTLARTMIILGWAISGLGAVLMLANGAQSRGNMIVVAIAAICIGIIAGALNHGLWQALVALFDIADTTHNAHIEADKQTELLRRMVTRSSPDAPAPPPTRGEIWAPAPLPRQPDPPPAGIRPGETAQQWAKRIQDEEAAAFRARNMPDVRI